MEASQRKRVKYVGPSPRVAVLLPDGAEVYCDREKSISVPADTADSLLEQSIWETGRGVKGEDAPKKEDK